MDDPHDTLKGIICIVQPADATAPSHGIVVRADLEPTAMGAFRVATSWVVGLLQAGGLLEGEGEYSNRPAVSERLLWKVRRGRVVGDPNCVSLVEGVAASRRFSSLLPDCCS